MIQTCKNAGVDIYVDAVFNHMAAGSGVGFAGTHFSERQFFPLWDKSEFHHDPLNMSENCVINWTEWKHNKITGGDPPKHILWNCDLSGLPDLNVSRTEVKQKIVEQLVRFIDLGAGGFRIDAAKHMSPKDLEDILAAVKAARSDSFPRDVALELFSSEEKPVKPSMYLGVGQIEYFNYPNILSDAIMSGNMDMLRDVENFLEYPSNKSVVFMDNHDTQRDGIAPLTYRNLAQYVLANVFMLAHPFGYPKVMSSFYFDPITGQNDGPPKIPVHTGTAVNCGDGKPWVCEHRNPAIANMVQWRRVAGQASPSHWHSSPGRIAFARGQAFVAFNGAPSSFPWSAWSEKFQTGLPAGLYCDIIQSDDPDSCPYVSVDKNGAARLWVPSMSSAAFRIGALASKANAAHAQLVNQLYMLAAGCAMFLIAVVIYFSWRRSRRSNDMAEPFLAHA
jgi:alpha-amylase